MSEHFQPGQHPDADRLSAFIDHALSPHERQETLTHLAQCADCRSIVFLAQETAVEELPAEEPVAPLPPLRKRWFTGWTLAWPTAAVMACLILAAVYTRQLLLHQNESISTNTAINAPLPVKPTPPQTDSAPPHPQNPAGSPAGKATEESKPSSPSLGANTITTQNLPTRSRQVDRLSSQQEIAGAARSNGAIGGLALRPRTQVNAAPGFADGTANGQGASFGAAAGVAGKSLAPVTRAEANANPLTLSATQSAPSNGYILKSAPAPQISVGAVAVSPPDHVSEFTITNAQPMMTDASAKKLAAPQQQFNLPSHLETVSSISNARMILVIDSVGTLFASKDAGKHWKSISAPWAGRAVKVDFAFAMPYARMKVPAIEEMRDKKKRAANVDSIEAAPPPAKPAVNASLTGIVTDRTGAVISKASVTVMNPQTAQSITVRTDDTGHYTFQKLEPGVYTVKAQSSGFQTATINRLDVAAAQPVVKNMTLEVGSATETVSVEASNSSLQTDRPEIVATIDSQSVAETHPTIFELTTDTGEVWTSIDGRHWKRK